VRTTLDIDDDLIAAAKELAQRERSSAGKVISRLLRHSLTGSHAPGARSLGRVRAVAGFRPFPAQPGIVVTDEAVNALRETEGI
jgi:Arc/MetJ family transcription regulator